MSEYRLIQGGRSVAKVYGPDKYAWREIMHYAVACSQDGPVRIEKRYGGAWKVTVWGELI